MTLLQSGYSVAKVRIEYVSKLREDLASTIRKLTKTLDWCPSVDENRIRTPMASRLGRRAWRVWYNKAPHAIGWSKRHYIFHDWRYAFEFRDVSDIKYAKLPECSESMFLRRVMSSALGSMAPETSCKVNYAWHFPGSDSYRALVDPLSETAVVSEIEKGFANIQKANSATNDIKSCDQSIQKHLYLNYRHYIGDRVNS